MKTTQSKLETKAARLLSIDSRRKAHNASLSTLHASPLQRGEDHETRGLKMWRKLRALEQLAHRGAEAYCNGEFYRLTFPFGNQHSSGETSHNFSFKTDENAWERLTELIGKRVAAVFGGTLPTGFFINGDARGMALKLDPDRCTVPQGIETDWGRNGILAAEIND